MKKVFLVIISVLAMVGFTSCNQAVTETSIIGRWQLVSIQEGGVVITDSDYDDVSQVWEFTKDHKVLVSITRAGEEHAGTWALEGNQLTLQFVPMPMTVSLTSTTLILSASLDGETVKYTFKKL
ncbi:MAG: hypothetical protein IJ814_00780 [Paludibacteraceae bacterium]|nr:hypothetical protein [Paludibacteraceae bacterium]